ncbi:alpha/beta hydrolase-fold protein [Frateuria sp. YIM B11624]|uniref:alpha/beta hydrolase-fold protein n=1 Tax=Frateuria sp. YIM B11624 TaxID=3143185 RepID=UPI003C7790F1
MRLQPSALLHSLAALLLAACSTGGDVTRPIPTRFIPAAQPAHRLVVMLPGRGDDADSLARRGTAQIIHGQWPDADVVLAGLTMPFYRQGRAVQRLHDEILAPARARHYDQVWLAGISLGGLGALMYDRAYPGQLDGMLLISPYLGDRPLYREIQAAGGLDLWRPGPAQAFTPATYQRELWRYIQRWSDRPGRPRSVWLAYGDKERFRDRIGLLAAQLPAGQVFRLPGHHNWTLWKPALRTLLDHAGPEQNQRPRIPPDAALPAVRTDAGRQPDR